MLAILVSVSWVNVTESLPLSKSRIYFFVFVVVVVLTIHGWLEAYIESII